MRITRIIVLWNNVNNRFEGQQWPEIKKKLYDDGSLAYGSVPMLENKGNKIVQSLAIGRYLGRQYNLFNIVNNFFID